MKKHLLIVTLLALSNTACTTIADNSYLKLGAGYKFNEMDIYYQGESIQHPISARIELGSSYENFSFGYSHHSQWFQGAPFNADEEYSKDEVFIDYKIPLKGFLFE